MGRAREGGEKPAKKESTKEGRGEEALQNSTVVKSTLLPMRMV